jgi:hypothetical protein
MKLKINQIVGMFDKSKDGKPFVTQYGKPYKKATVKFVETGEKLVSMPVWSGQKDPIVGDMVEGEITEREWKGNKYYDFKADKKDDKAALEVAQLKFSIANTNRKLDSLTVLFYKEFPKYDKKDMTVTSTGSPMPDFGTSSTGKVEPIEEEVNAMLGMAADEVQDIHYDE